jgi:hypothetical protein
LERMASTESARCSFSLVHVRMRYSGHKWDLQVLPLNLQEDVVSDHLCGRRPHSPQKRLAGNAGVVRAVRSPPRLHPDPQPTGHRQVWFRPFTLSLSHPVSCEQRALIVGARAPVTCASQFLDGFPSAWAVHSLCASSMCSVDRQTRACSISCSVYTHRRSHVLGIEGSGPPLPVKKNEEVCCGMGSEHGQVFKG